MNVSSSSQAGIGSLHHFKIISSHLERSLEFYRDALGFELLYEAERSGIPVYDRLMGYPDVHLKLAMLRLPGEGPQLALLQFLNPRTVCEDGEFRRAGTVALTLEVKDLAGVLARLESRGVRLLCPLQTIVRDGRRVADAAYVADPDGLRIELYEPAV